MSFNFFHFLTSKKSKNNCTDICASNGLYIFRNTKQFRGCNDEAYRIGYLRWQLKSYTCPVKNHYTAKIGHHLLRCAIKPFARYRLSPFPCRHDSRDRVGKNNKDCKNQKMFDGKEKREYNSATNGIGNAIVAKFKNVVDNCFHYSSFISLTSPSTVANLPSAYLYKSYLTELKVKDI